VYNLSVLITHIFQHISAPRFGRMFFQNVEKFNMAQESTNMTSDFYILLPVHPEAIVDFQPT
jgi:hypothetical protein